jgi:hypothetical protein
MFFTFSRPVLGRYIIVVVIIIIIIIISGSTALVKTLTASHRTFCSLTKTHGRTPLDEWSARRKGLYLHRTTQHRNTKTNIQASSGIRTHDPSNQAAKTYALDQHQQARKCTYNVTILAHSLELHVCPLQVAPVTS